jgi:LemA protein
MGQQAQTPNDEIPRCAIAHRGSMRSLSSGRASRGPVGIARNDGRRSFCYLANGQKGGIPMRRLWTVLAALATLSLTNCGYNAIQTNDEQVKSAWSEVLNQYQRRADLVPNLVNSVKGFAQQEKDVLLGVTNARAKVGSIQATPELINDPGAFAKFQQAQGELTSALSKLLVVTENYPQLKSDALFRDLLAQLEGTENRITVARNRYIKSVQDYNVTIRTFPTNLTAMAFGYKDKANFTVDNEKEISTAPKVDFNPAPAPAK